MEAVPSTSSALVSPPKKRKRLNLGHLSLAEKQCILNMYKQMRADEVDMNITAIVSKIVNTVGKMPNSLRIIVSIFKNVLF